MGRPFLAAYLSGDPAARALLALDFQDPAARAAHVRRAVGRTIAPELAAELAAQEAALPPSASRRANLEALIRGEAAVVVTGQQAGLFLGPLYTFYKAASAVAAARTLERDSGVRCVPLFWLQTEDHDFEEIAACHLLGADGAPCTMRVAADPACSSRTSIAHRRLGPDVDAALAELERALGALPAAGEVVALLRAHYRPGVPLGRAFGGAIAELFADDGLLVLDPRVPAVARLAAPLYRRAITEHAAIARLLAERRATLLAAGLDEQVPVRPSCALAFFHDEGPAGPRYRLEASAGGWALAGGGRKVAARELEACLEDAPLRFSTSALLRPLVQDSLLPTACYLGGPAEVGYFAQLGPLYDHFGLPQPLVAPRARFRCLDEKSQRLLARLGLSAGDLERPQREVLGKLANGLATRGVPGHPGDGALAFVQDDRDSTGSADTHRAAAGTIDRAGGPLAPQALARQIEAALAPALARLEAEVTAVDRTLARPAERTAAQIRRSIERLVDKYGRALARRDATTMARVERLRTLLYPEEHPQERHYGWPALAARAGRARFAAAVAGALVPFAAEVGELVL